MLEDKFWSLIEAKMGCNVPKYLQNLLKLRGYENAISIQTITKEDIDELTTYAKSEEMKARIPVDCDPKDYFGDYFWSTPENFYVLPGHVKLLLKIVDFINITLATKGYDFFSVKPKTTYQGTLKFK